MICTRCGLDRALYNGVCHECLGSCRKCNREYNSAPGWKWGLCPECAKNYKTKLKLGCLCKECGAPYDGRRGWSPKLQYCPACHSKWKEIIKVQGCLECKKPGPPYYGWVNGVCPSCVNKSGCCRCGKPYDGKSGWNGHACPDCLKEARKK